jgi:hypothetical protein
MQAKLGSDLVEGFHTLGRLESDLELELGAVASARFGHRILHTLLYSLFPP